MSRFLVGEELSREIHRILAEPRCSCAVAFWGKGAEAKLTDQRSGVRLICNLSSGGTNPNEISKIDRSLVRQIDELHAKVYIGNSQAIVTSANISSNGIGQEDVDAAFWMEAGYITDKIEPIKTWFDELWKRARCITDEDLNEAFERWRRRQNAARRRFEVFDETSANLPLLYWITDYDWEPNEEFVRNHESEIGDVEQMIADGLEVEKGDRDVMRPGTWMLVWWMNNQSMPHRRKSPYWFKTGELAENSFRYFDETEFRDCSLPAIVQSDPPFALNGPLIKVIKETLAEDGFAGLREEAKNGKFYTPKRLSLHRDFWRTCKRRYSAAVSK